MEDSDLLAMLSKAAPLTENRSLPESFGPYRIIAQLGEGGMATVYRAEHTTLGRVVALKVLKHDFVGKPGFTQLFLREAKLAATVEHPNVVPIYDAGEMNGRLYMALRYIPGGDVMRKLQERHRLSVVESLQIAMDCAKGLAAIHKAGLIHRDIKPGNIFLEEDGIALLADLGIARAVNADESLTKIYMPGLAMGTPAYMSPEQARGQSNIDIRSDIYALGATLFQILTGREVFQGNTEFETVAKVIYEPPPDPRTFNPDVPQALVTVIHRALDKDREKRYQTPLEMLDGLRAIRDGMSAPQRASDTSFTRATSPSAPVAQPAPVAPAASVSGVSGTADPSQSGMATRCPVCQKVVFENEMVDLVGRKVCSNCVKGMLQNAEQGQKPAVAAPAPAVAPSKPPTSAIPIARPTTGFPVAPTSAKTVIYRGRVVQAPGTGAIPIAHPTPAPIAAADAVTAPPPAPVAPAKPAPETRAVPMAHKTGGSFITRFFSASPAPVETPQTTETPLTDQSHTTIYRGRVVSQPGLDAPPPPEAAPVVEEAPAYEDGDVDLLADAEARPATASDSGSRLKSWISKLARDVGRSTGIISEKHDLELSGELGRYRLLQVIQFLNSSTRTGELHVNGPNIEGLVAFDKGEIFFAYTGNRMGIQAVYQCVFAKEGTFRFEGSKMRPPRSKIISMPTMQILLECCRQLDEKATLPQ